VQRNKKERAKKGGTLKVEGRKKGKGGEGNGQEGGGVVGKKRLTPGKKIP